MSRQSASQTLSHPILLLSQIFDFRGHLHGEECRTWLGLELLGTSGLKSCYALNSDYSFDRVEDRERDESAIILTSCSESQRVHCPGKIGRHGGRGQGRSSDLLIISHQTQPTFRGRKNHPKFFVLFFCIVCTRKIKFKKQTLETEKQ